MSATSAAPRGKSCGRRWLQRLFRVSPSKAGRGRRSQWATWSCETAKLLGWEAKVQTFTKYTNPYSLGSLWRDWATGKGEVQYKSRSRVYQVLRISSQVSKQDCCNFLMCSIGAFSFILRWHQSQTFLCDFCLNTRQQNNTHTAPSSQTSGTQSSYLKILIFSAGLPRLRVNASICAGAAHQLRGYCLTTA